MRYLRSRWFPYAAVAVVLGVPSAWLLARDPQAEELALVAHVKRGEFKVSVSTSGELRAKESVSITVPAASQQAGAYQMKISSIIPEGTIVKAGDIVAELDRAILAPQLTNYSLALQKAQAQLEQAMLDSTLNLSTAREAIKTLELGLEERRLANEQAVYEAPTVKRQAAIDLEKAQRQLTQSKSDYKTKVEQAQAKLREVGADVQRQQNMLRIVQEVMMGFTIRAPEAGMVIYVKEYNGRKRTTGSQVSSWDNTVATLPDLTRMESVTYVNEIDIRKVTVGQPVAITLDSDPDKKLIGTVTSVANVGEQRPNQDAKVFEVKITIAGTDTTLRPGMTTGNGIETFKIDSVLFIPLEALDSEGGVPFVYRQNGRGVTKQEVETGAISDDEVVIVRGLEEGDRVQLSPPANRDQMELERLPGSRNQPGTAGGDTGLRVPMGPAGQPASPQTSPRPQTPGGPSSKPVPPGGAMPMPKR